MTLQTFITTALIALGGLFAAPSSPDADRCADACAEYLADEDASLRCMVQCEVELDQPELRAPVTDPPDWMTTSELERSWSTDHAWCLATCDDESRSATDRETCRLNCATSWSVLTTTPDVCDGDARGGLDGYLCVDPEVNSCERGCFADKILCRDACAEREDARATNIESCKLRCDNVGDLCSHSCTNATTDTDDDVTAYDTATEPGC